MSFSEYLRLYKTSWLKLQTTSPQLNSYEDRSLYTTWQLSLQRIEQQNALSAKLLKLWAYFDRQDVWFELLRHGSSADDGWIQKLTEDELSFTEAVRVLSNYGLVDPDLSLRNLHGSGGYSMHSCVHSWTVFVLNKEWDERLARLALTCIASEIPLDDKKNWWVLQQRLLQHAAKHVQFITEGKVKLEGMEWALQGLGNLYRGQDKLAEAEEMYTWALQGNEEAFGPKHISTLSMVNNLGILYMDQGKLAEAEEMLTLALQGYEEALGLKLVSSYTSALNTMRNLGNVYSQSNKKDMAKTMYKRALSGFAAVQGPSSATCRETERLLEALDLAPAESDIPEAGSTQTGIGKSKSFFRKFLREIRR